MNYEAIRDTAKRGKRDFIRIIENEIYKLEGGRVLAVSKMNDKYHDMEIAVLLSCSFHIEEIAGRMARTPYPCCETSPLEMLSLLKGIAVMESGAMKQVRERIPRNKGCTHIYEMIESSFRAIFAGSHDILYGNWEELIDINPDEHRQLGIHAPVLAGSCHAFDALATDPETFERAWKKFLEAQRRRNAIKAMQRENV
jgi:hypothetical protein